MFNWLRKLLWDFWTNSVLAMCGKHWGLEENCEKCPWEKVCVEAR